VGELPFWIFGNRKRERLFKNDLTGVNMKSLAVFPRAVTLTLFLRLFRTDYFIHGIGGANYEWVQDRVIENFYNQTPPDYIVVSGTFLLPQDNNRNYPYFFYDKQVIRSSLI